jgi:predicted RNase H-like nuclease (RuvC/YqgF family)
MRDLSAHEKHELQKLQKDLDQKKSEIAELARTKEKLSARVEELEHQIVDLQEQVCGSVTHLVLYRVYQSDWHGLEVDKFTSMLNRIINTSSNERIIVQVYDTCPQMLDVCTLGHMAHIDAIVQFLPHSDQHAAVLYFFLYKGTPLSETADTSV